MVRRCTKRAAPCARNLTYRWPRARLQPPKMKLELTEQQRAEIRQAFDLFDTDGQGARADGPHPLCPHAPARAALTR